MLRYFHSSLNTKSHLSCFSFCSLRYLYYKKVLELKAIAYVSQSLNETEKKYCQIEMEALTILLGYMKHQIYNLGKNLKLR